TIVFVPAIVLLFVLELADRRLTWSSALLHLGLVLIPACLMYLPWALRNLRIYGTATPEYLSVARLTWKSSLIGLASAIHNLLKSFWAFAGFSNNVGYPFPLAGFIFLWLCLIWREPQRSINPAEEAPSPRPSPPRRGRGRASAVHRPLDVYSLSPSEGER